MGSSGRHVVGRLADPIGHSAFSEVRRSEPKRAPTIYTRFRNINDATRLATFVLIVYFGISLIGILYPHRYELVGWFIPLLALNVLAARSELLKIFLLSGGDSRMTMYSSIVQAAAVLALIPIGFWLFGVAGAIMASALSPLATAPLLAIGGREILGARRTLVDIAGSCLVAAISLITYLEFGAQINRLYKHPQVAGQPFGDRREILGRKYEFMGTPVYPMSLETLSVDDATSRQIGHIYSEGYKAASPYNHICIDGFLPEVVLEKILFDLGALAGSDDAGVGGFKPPARETQVSIQSRRSSNSHEGNISGF